jgi:hypothetical protein
MAASALVRPRVRSFEVFGLRRAYHQSYRGDNNAVITRFGWHVQDDPNWPTAPKHSSLPLHIAGSPGRTTLSSSTAPAA